jgi:hypothetical protein
MFNYPDNESSAGGGLALSDFLLIGCKFFFPLAGFSRPAISPTPHPLKHPPLFIG